MSTQIAYFAQLHRAGDPLLLYNIWDAGSARIVADAGAKAIATGSLAMAGAHGFEDGESLPLRDLLINVRRIIAAVDLPVSVDFEGGYATDPAHLAEHAAQLRETGAVGCNLEDRVITGGGLYPSASQAQRIAAVAASGIFVNARCDLFLARLMAGEDPDDPRLMPEALERAAAYAEAGARCFFVPGLSDPELIARLSSQARLPINVMMRQGMADPHVLAAAGVARISWGPAPWFAAMAALGEHAAAAFAARRGACPS